MDVQPVVDSINAGIPLIQTVALAVLGVLGVIFGINRLRGQVR